MSGPLTSHARSAIVESSTGRPRPASTPPRNAGTTAAMYFVAAARCRGQTSRERANPASSSSAAAASATSSSTCTWAQAKASVRSGSWATGAFNAARRSVVASPITAASSSTTTSTSHGISRSPKVVAGVSSHGRWGLANSTIGNRFGSLSTSPSTGSVRTIWPAARRATSPGPRRRNDATAGSWTCSTVSRASTDAVCCRGTPSPSTVPPTTAARPRCAHGANVTWRAVTGAPCRVATRSCSSLVHQ